MPKKKNPLHELNHIRKLHAAQKVMGPTPLHRREKEDNENRINTVANIFANPISKKHKTTAKVTSLEEIPVFQETPLREPLPSPLPLTKQSQVQTFDQRMASLNSEQKKYSHDFGQKMQLQKQFANERDIFNDKRAFICIYAAEGFIPSPPSKFSMPEGIRMKYASFAQPGSLSLSRRDLTYQKQIACIVSPIQQMFGRDDEYDRDDFGQDKGYQFRLGMLGRNIHRCMYASRLLSRDKDTMYTSELVDDIIKESDQNFSYVALNAGDKMDDHLYRVKCTIGEEDDPLQIFLIPIDHYVPKKPIDISSILIEESREGVEMAKGLSAYCDIYLSDIVSLLKTYGVSEVVVLDLSDANFMETSHEKVLINDDVMTSFEGKKYGGKRSKRNRMKTLSKKKFLSKKKSHRRRK